MNSSSSARLLACTSFKATAWTSQFDPVRIWLASYLEESPAPEIKDLDVWTDWVSSPGTVALSIGQRRPVVDCTQEAREVAQVPGMSADGGWHWQNYPPVAALNSLQRGDDP